LTTVSFISKRNTDFFSCDSLLPTAHRIKQACQLSFACRNRNGTDYYSLNKFTKSKSVHGAIPRRHGHYTFSHRITFWLIGSFEAEATLLDQQLKLKS